MILEYKDLNSDLTVFTIHDHVDGRGELLFCNEFDMTDIKRFYIINSKPRIVRAWQGHKYEEKHIKVLKGSFVISLVKLDDFENPSLDLEPIVFRLNSEDKVVIKIPSGYANGIMACEKDSSILIYSNKHLSESLKDDFRFEKDLWLNWSNL